MVCVWVAVWAVIHELHTSSQRSKSNLPGAVEITVLVTVVPGRVWVLVIVVPGSVLYWVMYDVSC